VRSFIFFSGNSLLIVVAGKPAVGAAEYTSIYRRVIDYDSWVVPVRDALAVDEKIVCSSHTLLPQGSARADSTIEELFSCNIKGERLLPIFTTDKEYQEYLSAIDTSRTPVEQRTATWVLLLLTMRWHRSTAFLLCNFGSQLLHTTCAGSRSDHHRADRVQSAIESFLLHS
jgi:hypothetical protein